jgi:hypothetical protein
MSNNHSAGVKRAAGRIVRAPLNQRMTIDAIADIIAEETGVGELVKALENAPDFGGEPKTAFGREYRDWQHEIKHLLAKYGGK